MRQRLKGVLIGVLCVAFGGGSLLGCSDYKATPLPYYGYAEVERDGNYDSALFYRNDLVVPLGDPTMLAVEEDGVLTFYCTGTTSGTGYDIYKSTDFINWEWTGAFKPARDNFGATNFWAPQIIFDPDAKWSDYNVRDAAGNGDGTGLYVLTYSANTRNDQNKYMRGVNLPGIAFSTAPGGPYKEFNGTNADGRVMTAGDILFDLRYINPAGYHSEDGRDGIYAPDTSAYSYEIRNLDENAEPGQELWKPFRSFIDAMPFIDPVTGNKYLYLARSRTNDSTNEIWGMKMKDWVTPDYTTVTRLTSYGYTTTERTEELNHQSTGSKIDEGPFLYYHDGQYYLTFSIGDTNDRQYPVFQALGDSPLGPFTKVQPEHDGMVCSPGTDWDINSSGHHAFFEVDDELWIVYHSYPIYDDGSIGARCFALDKVGYRTNDLGQTVLHANGPTKVVQPLPEAISGYRDMAREAKLKATNAANDTALLNDGIVKMHLWDDVEEFEVKGDSTKITLEWDEYIDVTAVLVYNSIDYFTTFDSIKRIEFSFKDENGKKGIGYIDGLGFNMEANQVPLKTILGEEYEDFKGDPSYITMRPGGAAVAEFHPISVNKITIEIERPAGRTGLKIDNVTVLGKKA